MGRLSTIYDQKVYVKEQPKLFVFETENNVLLTDAQWSWLQWQTGTLGLGEAHFSMRQLLALAIHLDLKPKVERLKRLNIRLMRCIFLLVILLIFLLYHVFTMDIVYDKELTAGAIANSSKLSDMCNITDFHMEYYDDYDLETCLMRNKWQHEWEYNKYDLSFNANWKFGGDINWNGIIVNERVPHPLEFIADTNDDICNVELIETVW